MKTKKNISIRTCGWEPSQFELKLLSASEPKAIRKNEMPGKCEYFCLSSSDGKVSLICEQKKRY